MNIIRTVCIAVVVAMTAAPVSTAFAQDAPSADATMVDDVVITARRAGLPIWQVERGGSTVILIGAIGGVPRDFEWRAEALESATARSQRILYPQDARASPADLFRLLWRIRTISKLPAGKTTADYLSPEFQARLETIMADERNPDWRTESFVGLGFDLLEKAEFERRGRGVVDAVRRAARDAHVDGRPVGIVRGDELIDNLITQPPQVYLPCVEAAIVAAEAGPAGAADRLDAWRSLHVPQVLANPLDKALNLCWPSGDPEIAPLLRTQWAEATQTSLAQPGVTLAVVSLRILAEPGGVLDQLSTQGLEVVGPEWKTSADAEAPTNNGASAR